MQFQWKFFWWSWIFIRFCLVHLAIEKVGNYTARTGKRSEQLEQLNEFVKTEWIGKGSRAEHFQQKTPKIILILDNGWNHWLARIVEKGMLVGEVSRIRGIP